MSFVIPNQFYVSRLFFSYWQNYLHSHAVFQHSLLFATMPSHATPIYKTKLIFLNFSKLSLIIILYSLNCLNLFASWSYFSLLAYLYLHALNFIIWFLSYATKRDCLIHITFYTKEKGIEEKVLTTCWRAKCGGYRRRRNQGFSLNFWVKSLVRWCHVLRWTLRDSRFTGSIMVVLSLDMLRHPS